MSTFTEHKTTADRSASDRRRHKQKIEKAIKEGLKDIVAEESIIGQDGKKKVKIPVRGIKEFRFVYGDNDTNQRSGTASGKQIHRGQKIGESPNKKKAPGNNPGNEPGEEYYEVELTLDEVAKYLFEDLELPKLMRKSLKKTETEKFTRHGYRPKGIIPRLDKKKSAISRIKRKKAASSRDDFDENEDFSFCEDDLTYKHFKKIKKPNSNAVIFFVMDISGSMTKNKKFLARSFFFLLYQFIRSKYEQTDVVFVSHDTSAYVVNEDQFFTRGNSGGTLVSSGLEKVLEVVDKQYHPSSWNIYVFQSSDGDNWPDDLDPTMNAIEKLKSICNLFGYCEITPPGEGSSWSNEWRLSNVYKSVVDSKFKMAEIKRKRDVWDAFKSMFYKRIKVAL